jgi:threonine dehydrogenase-like Zn-dependent dehydrogenase
VKALVFDGKLSLKDLPVPKPATNEALVRVLTAGICKTDVEISRGYMNFQGILGHEFVGIVEQSPNIEQLGCRVVGEINAGCGTCSWCKAGMERHCPNRTCLGILGRNGAMAEYLTLPPSNLITVPENLSSEKAVFAEPLAAALEILEQVHIKPADEVLVIGDGKLGLLICMVLRLTGCKLLLVGKHAEKLEYFEKLHGSTALLHEFADTRDKFDIVVEASGSPGGWRLAVDRVKPRGTLILKSTYHGNLEFNPAPLVIDEITVVGSRCGQLAPALRIMSLGLVDPAPLISGIFPLAEAETAFVKSQESASMKVLLKIDTAN